jgi:hypothetical protein
MRPAAPSKLVRGLCLAAALLCAFCGKEKTLAGGYDDVENPALTVSLKDTLGNAYGSGEVRLYARYQNPGEDSIPLIVRDVSLGKALSIRDTSLIRAMTLSQARGTPWPGKDTLDFNLVASDFAMGAAPASGGEAFLGGFRLIKGADGVFRFRRLTGGSYAYPDAKGRFEASPVMAAPVLDLRGRIGARGMQLGLKSVFIAGSPYRAPVESDGSFNLARVAAGRFEMNAVSADAKVYTAADSLITGSAFEPSDWSEADLIWVE